jgi:hypothetical protein
MAIATKRTEADELEARLKKTPRPESYQRLMMACEMLSDYRLALVAEGAERSLDAQPNIGRIAPQRPEDRTA